MPDFTTHPTPNPDSLKITTDAGPFIDEGMAAFQSAEEAEEHPLGRRLFALGGVDNVLIMPGFLTISKRRGTMWDLLMPKVQKVLSEHFEEQEEA